MHPAPVLFALAHPAYTLREALTIRLLLHGSRKARAQTFSIHVPNYLDEPNDLIERVAAALRLINETELRRYQRIARDLTTFIVRDIGVSCYSFATNVCTLDQRLVRTKSAGSVALVIIHEAAHARLYHAGIVTWRRIQSRVERACIGEEIAFARKLGTAGWEVADEMIAALERTPTDSHAIEQAVFRARARAMEESSLPRWVVRAWIALCRPRHWRRAP